MGVVNSKEAPPPIPHLQLPLLHLSPTNHSSSLCQVGKSGIKLWDARLFPYCRGHRGQAVQLGDLQNILSSMNIPAATEPQESKLPPPSTLPFTSLLPCTEPEEAIGLNDVVTSDVLRPLSSDSSVQEQLQPHIPPTSETVADVLTSPQFQQALGVFGSALQSGQLGPLISQFGMGQDVINAANTGSMFMLSVYVL